MCNVGGMTKLDDHLKQNSIRRRDFAAQIGVHESVLSRFCNGLARPALDTAFAIEWATNGAVPASSWVEEQQRAV
jgi:DNA-binding transcriptional regulator YdaS (Cro superfamily)